MHLVLFLPSVLLLLTALAGCGTTGTTGATITDEARCRQSGGSWRSANAVCEQGGGGY